jgi:hypothetical protein
MKLEIVIRIFQYNYDKLSCFHFYFLHMVLKYTNVTFLEYLNISVQGESWQASPGQSIRRQWALLNIIYYIRDVKFSSTG